VGSPIPLIIIVSSFFTLAVLDLRSVFQVQAIACLALGAHMLLVLASSPTCKGFRDWMLAAFGLSAFSLLISLRNLIPDAFSIVAANLIGVQAMVCLLRGLYRFYELNWPRWLELLPLLLLPFLLIFTYLHPSYHLRVISYGLCMVLLCALGLSSWRSYRSHSGFALAVWMIVMFTLTLLTFLIHVAAVCLLPPDYGHLASNFLSEWMFSCLYPLSNFGLFLGLIAAHAGRLQSQLQQALNEVRTLRGVIPVCCACKRIMNDKGHWDQMETYISHHTEAQFSHDYCPECASKVMDRLHDAGSRPGG